MKNRSTFSIYRFDTRDRLAAGFLALMTIIVIFGVSAGRCLVEFYPAIVMAEFDYLTAITCAAYLGLCFFPVAAELKEVAAWKLSQSRI